MEGGESMINMYSQYSFAGYKIFRLSSELPQEVTAANRLDLPDSAVKLFSHYGIKLLLSRDKKGYYILFINDIPCRETDDMGRLKTCSLVMVGTNLKDAQVLRRIAVMLMFELDNFEKFFNSLFTIRERLEFDYPKMKEFIDKIITDQDINDDRVRKALYFNSAPIVVYTTLKSKNAFELLEQHFDKSAFRHGFMFKWNETTRNVDNSVVEKYGFLSLLYKIINKLTSIWKN